MDECLKLSHIDLLVVRPTGMDLKSLRFKNIIISTCGKNFFYNKKHILECCQNNLWEHKLGLRTRRFVPTCCCDVAVLAVTIFNNILLYFSNITYSHVGRVGGTSTWECSERIFTKIGEYSRKLHFFIDPESVPVVSDAIPTNPSRGTASVDCGACVGSRPQLALCIHANTT